MQFLHWWVYMKRSDFRKVLDWAENTVMGFIMSVSKILIKVYYLALKFRYVCANFPIVLLEIFKFTPTLINPMNIVVARAKTLRKADLLLSI